MDGIFGALIWLIIIFIWGFSVLKKTRRADSDVQKRSPSEFEKKILEALGISFPEIPEPTIQQPSTRDKVDSAQEEKKQEPASEVPKPATDRVILKEAEEEFTPLESLVPLEKSFLTGFTDLLTEEKLQEGIVLSIILGPPKAYQL